jgi:hypothetical protein
MIETSLCHSFDMFLNVSRVHFDNYCEMLAILNLTHAGQVRKPPFNSLYGESFVPLTVKYIHFDGIYRIMNEKFKTKK